MSSYELNEILVKVFTKIHSQFPTQNTSIQEELGGASSHTTKSGVAHDSYPNDVAALRAMRRLMDFLPSSNDKSTLPVKDVTDPVDRLIPAADLLVPDDPNMPYDMKDIIRQTVDNGDIFEIMPGMAQNIVTTFARMGGETVGVVGKSCWSLFRRRYNDVRAHFTCLESRKQSLDSSRLLGHICQYQGSAICPFL